MSVFLEKPCRAQNVIEHSARGTTWKEHKYIKRIDGTYYYPDNYEGGRHLPSGENDSNSSNERDNLEDWEVEMYSDIDDTLERNPGLFDPLDLATGDLQDFRLTLAEFAGIDADSLSDTEIKRMQDKMISYYTDRQSARNLSAQDVENLAREVIRGNFGNGQIRKDLLGENYQEIQNRVNEILRGQIGNQPVSNTDSSTSSESTQETIDNAIQAASNAGIDMNIVYSVYNKRLSKAVKEG